MKQFIFSFDDKKISKLKNKKNLLGGKGANLAEMGKLGLPVPQVLQLPQKSAIFFIQIKKNCLLKFYLKLRLRLKKLKKKHQKNLEI